VAVTSPTATATSCDDGSKYTQINPVTGAVDPAFVNLPLDQQYVFVTWNMPLRAGHWSLASISALTPPTAAAKQCLPSAPKLSWRGRRSRAQVAGAAQAITLSR
jgi:hypothetical protein